VIVRNYTRRAFSLIELLVVIAIITILAGLVMAGVSAIRTLQQSRTTDDIVTKVQNGIEVQRKAMTDQARADRRARTQDFQNLLTYCGGDEDRAEALLMYLKLRHVFPQTYAEATSNVTIAGYINWPPHKAYAGIPNLSSLSAEQQSAALLYFALLNMGASGNSFEMDSVNSAKMDIATGVTVFKDGWNNPVGFKRFYEAAELNNSPFTDVKSTFKDPYDVLGKLSGWNPTPSTLKTNAQTAVGSNFDNNNKSITAFSAGQDKAYNTADDVFGYRLLKLGNKGTP
jgi:prepilin-type N-terminal cleavage/methylation domain-containing protein